MRHSDVLVIKDSVNGFWHRSQQSFTVTLGIEEKLIIRRARSSLAPWTDLDDKFSNLKVTLIGNGLEFRDDGVIFPGQCQS